MWTRVRYGNVVYSDNAPVRFGFIVFSLYFAVDYPFLLSLYILRACQKLLRLLLRPKGGVDPVTISTLREFHAYSKKKKNLKFVPGKNANASFSHFLLPFKT